MALNGNSMLLGCRLSRFSISTYRFICKISVDVHKSVVAKIEDQEITPRHHPGVQRTGQLSLPSHIVKGITRSTCDYPVKRLVKEGGDLSRYINARHPPPEESLYRRKLTEIELEVDAQLPAPNLAASVEEIEYYKKKRDKQIKKLLKQRIIKWKPIIYGQYEALLYAIGRGAQEYAVLMKILKEVAQRNPDFQPRSYFDFGSGVGTGMWAVSSLWKNSIFEYFNVDSSRHMNDLSDLILRGGSENKESILRNVSYRQFLPATENKYDLVVSAFSLFELPDAKHRKEVLLNLWAKCDGYLILVEEGTRHGFELIAEARKFILDLSNLGHVFSPCPHDLLCPRLATDTRTPCNFEVNFQTLPVGSNAKIATALYSYVVLKKGPREESEENKWPRLVRQNLVRSKHTICRLCTSKGNLQEVIFTSSKHGKLAYHCARSSKWGDRLPMNIGEK